jgi:hypothetical protein
MYLGAGGVNLSEPLKELEEGEPKAGAERRVEDFVLVGGGGRKGGGRKAKRRQAKSSEKTKRGKCRLREGRERAGKAGVTLGLLTESTMRRLGLSSHTLRAQPGRKADGSASRGRGVIGRREGSGREEKERGVAGKGVGRGKKEKGKGAPPESFERESRAQGGEWATYPQLVNRSEGYPRQGRRRGRERGREEEGSGGGTPCRRRQGRKGRRRRPGGRGGGRKPACLGTQRNRAGPREPPLQALNPPPALPPCLSGPCGSVESTEARLGSRRERRPRGGPPPLPPPLPSRAFPSSPRPEDRLNRLQGRREGGERGRRER